MDKFTREELNTAIKVVSGLQGGTKDSILDSTRTFLILLRDLERSPEYAVAPITCCGEWTWDTFVKEWRRKHDGLCEHADGTTILVCRKCHRALLSNGKLTGPLVDFEALNTTAPSAEALSTDSEYGRGALLLNKTWGPAK